MISGKKKAIGTILTIGIRMQEKTNEVLMILSSITYSEKNEIKGISERNDLLEFYMMILKAEQIGEVTAMADRTKDYVPSNKKHN